MFVAAEDAPAAVERGRKRTKSQPQLNVLFRPLSPQLATAEVGAAGAAPGRGAEHGDRGPALKRSRLEWTAEEDAQLREEVLPRGPTPHTPSHTDPTADRVAVY